MKIRKNQKGFSHDFLLPVLVILAVGAMGTYFLNKSNANSLPPENGPIVYTSGGRYTDNVYRINADGSGKTLIAKGSLIDTSRDQKWALIKEVSKPYVAINIMNPEKRYEYPTPRVAQKDCKLPNPSDRYYSIHTDTPLFKQNIRSEMPPNVYMPSHHYPCGAVPAGENTLGVFVHDMYPGNPKPVGSPISFNNKSIYLALYDVGQGSPSTAAFRLGSVSSATKNMEGEYILDRNGNIKKLPSNLKFKTFASSNANLLSTDGKFFIAEDRNGIVNIVSTTDFSDRQKTSNPKNDGANLIATTIALDNSGKRLLHAGAFTFGQKHRLMYYQLKQKRNITVEKSNATSAVEAAYITASWSNRGNYIAYIRNFYENKPGKCELRIYSTVKKDVPSKTLDTLQECASYKKPDVKW